MKFNENSIMSNHLWEFFQSAYFKVQFLQIIIIWIVMQILFRSIFSINFPNKEQILKGTRSMKIQLKNLTIPDAYGDAFELLLFVGLRCDPFLLWIGGVSVSDKRGSLVKWFLISWKFCCWTCGFLRTCCFGVKVSDCH